MAAGDGGDEVRVLQNLRGKICKCGAVVGPGRAGLGERPGPPRSGVAPALSPRRGPPPLPLLPRGGAAAAEAAGGAEGAAAPHGGAPRAGRRGEPRGGGRGPGKGLRGGRGRAGVCAAPGPGGRKGGRDAAGPLEPRGGCGASVGPRFFLERAGEEKCPLPSAPRASGVCLSSRNCEIIDVQEVGGRGPFWKRSLTRRFLCAARVRRREGGRPAA